MSVDGHVFARVGEGGRSEKDLTIWDFAGRNEAFLGEMTVSIVASFGKV